MDRRLREAERLAVQGDFTAITLLRAMYTKTGIISKAIHVKCAYSGRGEKGSLHAVDPFMPENYSKHLCHGLNTVGNPFLGFPTCKPCIKLVIAGRVEFPNKKATIRFHGTTGPKMRFNEETQKWGCPCNVCENVRKTWKPAIAKLRLTSMMRFPREWRT